MHCAGHDNAEEFLKKSDLDSVIKEVYEKLPITNCTIHTVDWEIDASKLKKEYVQEVAENYTVF